MKLKVKGIRGAQLAEIEIPFEKIALIAGENGSGKSSIIESAQAVLGLEPTVKRGSALKFGDLVCDGFKEGTAQFESVRGTREVSYPSGVIRTLSGQGLLCNNWGIGLTKMMSLSVEDRAKELLEVTNTKITRERVLEEFKDVGLAPEHVDRLILMAFGNGWDVASKYAEGKAKELKGEFKGVTGIQWGSNQGLTFKPTGWEDDLEKCVLSDLKTYAEHTRMQLEDAIGAHAIARHAKPQGDIEGTQKEIDQHKQALAAAQSHMLNAQIQYDDMLALLKTITCNSCGAVGTVKNNVLVSMGATRPQSSVVEALGKTVQQSKEIYAELQIKMAKLYAQMENLKLPETVVENPPNLDELRETHDRALLRVSCRIAKDQGTHIHYQIVEWLKAAEIVSPEGLPRKALLQALEGFNAWMAKLCAGAGWSVVTISRDLELTYNGRPYKVLSKSEKYRADATVQLTISKMQKQEIVIFDEVDILDRKGRNCFFKALEKAKISALVAMTTFRSKEGKMEVPDLNKAGLGVTYIVDKGMCTLYDSAPVPV